MRPFSHLQAVILDWAGTTVDFGSRAPMGVFVEAFGRFGIELTVDEARGPMGMAKRDHVKALLALPRIAEAWAARHGRTPTEADIDGVYEVFVPLNVEVVSRFAELIPGTAETIAHLRRRGLKIGSTTGYTREIMAPLLPLAAAQGYAPDNLVCAGDLPLGRPAPLMMYRSFLDLEVWPGAAVVKVDDTAAGIGEGLNAGAWTVGVVLSGNGVGLARDELEALGPPERAERKAAAAATLIAAGAHYLIDTIVDLPDALAIIEGRLARRERP